MNVQGGGEVDPVKTAVLVLISMAAGMPMFAWLLLGEGGALGEFGSTQAYEAIKWVLIGLTLVFYFILSPFVIWPRILNSDSGTERDGTDAGADSGTGTG
jgi:hypothetical protein